MADVIYNPGFVSAEIDISNVFVDSDDDVQKITASSSSENIVTASVLGDVLTILEASPGISTIIGAVYPCLTR